LRRREYKETVVNGAGFHPQLHLRFDSLNKQRNDR